MPDQTLRNENLTSSLPIVIVGAGTVGLLLAHELMQKGKRIILIEAGSESIGSFKEDEYTNIGHAHNGVSIGRAKGIGGTTNLWGGQLAEFTQNDIESKGVFGQPSWPISWNELQYWYPAVYKKLGFSPNCPVEPEKLPLTGTGDILEIFHTRWLKQPNFRHHFQKDLENSELVTIFKNTLLTNLHFKGNVCVSADIIRDGGAEQLSGFDKIILANGTIEICRLLLISGKAEDCPYKENNWIGKYFQDHLNMVVGQITNPSKSLFSRFVNIIRNGEKLQPKIRINTTREDDQHLGITAFFSFDSKVSHHLDNVKQFGKAIMGRSQQKLGVAGKIKLFTKVISATPQILLIIYNYVKKNRIYVPFKSSISLSLQAQQISIPLSSVTISSNEFDKFNRPKAIIDWQIDGREFEKIREFCIKLSQYLNANKLGTLQFEKWFEKEIGEGGGSWLTHVSDVYHQAGGTIMSTTADTGVVDCNLKIHGTDNVFACGACVMPTSGYANTTLTALALTMRLANHLKN